MINKKPGLPLAAAVIFFMDFLTKQWAVSTLQGAPPVRLTPFLRFIYVENSGVAFGLFADGGAWQRWALIGLTLVLMGILIYYMYHTAQRWEKLASALMLAGALGNFVDRLRFGYVVDFIDAHIGAYHWPVFNVADMSISGGALLFMAVFFVKK